MIKAIRKVKKRNSIQGRRNRYHAYPIVIQYNAYDAATAKEVHDKLIKNLDRGFSMLAMPNTVTVRSLKRPRFLNYDDASQFNEEILRLKWDIHLLTIKVDALTKEILNK